MSSMTLLLLLLFNKTKIFPNKALLPCLLGSFFVSLVTGKFGGDEKIFGVAKNYLTD
jgi:hypothetical protein